MLEIKNVYKKFRNNILFEDVNLKFKKGEVIHLYGLNGSGKSTLFKMIADIMEPDRGEIVIEKGKRIGAVIENPGFIENETILYNLKYLYSLLNNYDEEAENKIKKWKDQNTKKRRTPPPTGLWPSKPPAQLGHLPARPAHLGLHIPPIEPKP